MNGDKDNTRKAITFALVSLGGGLMTYLAIMVPDSRNTAITAITSWTAMALVWYFGGKPRAGSS